MKNYLIVLILSFSMAAVFAQENAETTQSKPYKIYKGRQVYEGVEVVYQAGNIKFKESADSGYMNLKPNDITKIEGPMPVELRYILEKTLTGQFDAAVAPMKTKRGKDFLEQQNFCGWGKRLVVYYAYALIKTGDLVEAKKQLRSATAMVPGVDDALDKELLKIIEAHADVAGDNAKGARAKMDELVEKMRDEVKPFLYNLEGDLLVADGKQQEAVITYYKCLLLDKTNPWQKEYAKSKISEIYKQTNDPRADLVKKIN